MDNVGNLKAGSRKLSRFGRHPKVGYTIQASVWLEKDGELYIGGGRATLLEKLEQLGSIAAAARDMKLTYRNAWLWIDAMNRLAPSPLVEKITGGAGGGRTQLTDEGRRAIARYNELRAKLAKITSQE
ncbi:MAG: LysR family transcriptional regulator [Dehalococcoidia bacterium]|nr:LysR family transcriptional regulator [Dehalococcoidia bacterium]